jgi:cytochrome P450 family 135
VTATALPPGPSNSQLAQSIRWVARPAAMLEDCHRRYGDTFTIRIAHEGTWVFLAHPDAVKQVFTGDPRLLHAGEGNEVLGPVLGANSVLLLDEARHMAQRKLMLPPFHGERMRGYADAMRDIAERELDRWPRGERFAVWPSMNAITLEVIMRTVFGIEEGARRSELRGAISSLLRWATSPPRIGLLAVVGPQRLTRMRMFRRELEPTDALIYEEIARRRAAPDLEQREDVLSMLLQARHEDGSPMSDKELRDELMTLVVAGHETTASSLAWAVERLARHPHMIDRLREEAAAGEDEYVDAVIKETMRLRPILSLVLRKLTEPMEIGGWELPAGVKVAPCIYLVHRRPDVYPEPLRFRPERFLEQPAGTYTWFPFGGGVRRCIGASFAQLEMKIVLQALVSRMSWQPADPRPERLTRRAITLVPEHGAKVVAQPLPTPVPVGASAQAAAA